MQSAPLRLLGADPSTEGASLGPGLELSAALQASSQAPVPRIGGSPASQAAAPSAPESSLTFSLSIPKHRPSVKRHPGWGNPLYKTEQCESWKRTGACKYGKRCQFAHGREELRAPENHPKFKTQLCRHFEATGICPFGARCRFIHERTEHTPPESRPMSSLAQLLAAHGNETVPGLSTAEGGIDSDLYNDPATVAPELAVAMAMDIAAAGMTAPRALLPTFLDPVTYPQPILSSPTSHS